MFETESHVDLQYDTILVGFPLPSGNERELRTLLIPSMVRVS